MAGTTRTLSAVGTSNAAGTNFYKNPFQLSLSVLIAGTATATVQYTLDDLAGASDAIGTGLNWYPHPTLAAITASATGNLAFPVRAVRLQVTAWTSGPVTMTVLQAGP